VRTYICTQLEDVGAFRNLKSVLCYSERSTLKFGLDETWADQSVTVVEILGHHNAS
jgi:hypothetical protein